MASLQIVVVRALLVFVQCTYKEESKNQYPAKLSDRTDPDFERQSFSKNFANSAIFHFCRPHMQNKSPEAVASVQIIQNLA